MATASPTDKLDGAGLTYGEDSARDAFLSGVRALLPTAPGIGAWGLVTGVAMVQSGLTRPQAIWMTLAPFAGSAQLTALPLLMASAPLWVITAAAIVVNLRFVIYSLALRPYFSHLGVGARLVVGYFTGDLTAVRVLALFAERPNYPHRVAYFAGASACNWAAWQLGSFAGILGAAFIDRSSGLDFAGVLALLALVIPLCARKPALAGVAVASAVAVGARNLPLKLGLLAAVVAGVAAAMVAELATSRKRAPA